MAHSLTLFIAREATHGETFRAPPFIGTVVLAGGFVATPLEHAVIDALGDEDTATGRIEAAGTRLSRSGPVLFLETDYFGGAGGKEVAVWRDGTRHLASWDGDNGAHWLKDLPDIKESKSALDEAAIIAFEDADDVFAGFGLGRWRRTDEITAEIRAARGVRPPLGVILAGGQSTRMGGGDKGLLKLGDRTILKHVIDRLEPQASPIALNANGDPDRFAAYGLSVVSDSIAGFAGPLAGVLAGLDWAASKDATHIVTAAADTPFFPRDLVSSLMLAAEVQGQPIALAKTENGRHPTFGLWPVALRDDLRQALESGVRKVVQWTDAHGTAMAHFHDARFDPFFNVNTPEDLKSAEQLWATL